MSISLVSIPPVVEKEVLGRVTAHFRASGITVRWRALTTLPTYIDALEKVAIRRGITIREPFQGEIIGAFRVLAPSPARYGQLVIN